MILMVFRAWFSGRRPVLRLVLCVAKTSSISCDQVILADQATDASLSSDAVPRKIDGCGERFQRRGAVQGAMRPVLIVMGFVGVQDSPQMVRVPDEGAVQELAAASADPAFGDGVHPGRLDIAEYGPDPRIGEDSV